MVTVNFPLTLSPVRGFPQADKEKMNNLLEQAFLTHLGWSLTLNEEPFKASPDMGSRGNGLSTGAKRRSQHVNRGIKLLALLFSNIIPRVPEAKSLSVLCNLFSRHSPKLKHYPA